MDDRVSRALARRVVEGLVIEHEAAGLDDREQDQEEDRGNEGELRQRLPSAPPTRARVRKPRLIMVPAL